MTAEEEKLAEARAAMRELTETLQAIVADPSILASWEDAEVAWLMEHLELLSEETNGLRERIEDYLRSIEAVPPGDGPPP